LQDVVDRSASLPTSSDFEHLRSVPQVPDRILDAPDLRSDFYLNVLDWSSQNVIAIALGETVYLWNANDGTIHELLSTTLPNDYISSLSWSSDGIHLSVGTAMNQIQIWNIVTRQRIRTVRNDFGRIAATAWNGSLLSAGSRNGIILNHDIRIRDHVAQALRGGHHQEICGQWPLCYSWQSL
jgi:cell division cycle protein 20 (cofactor of APC complex)